MAVPAHQAGPTPAVFNYLELVAAPFKKLNTGLSRMFSFLLLHPATTLPTRAANEAGSG